MNANLPKFKIRKYRLWTYDVWGNAREGFDVNDRFAHGYVSIKCKRKDFNIGTEQQFSDWEPTDRQLSRAAGFLRCIWEGQEGTYYAEATSNGRPIGELDEEERPEFDGAQQ